MVFLMQNSDGSFIILRFYGTYRDGLSHADTKSSIRSVKYRDSHQLYDVVFGSTTIKTLVTRKPEIVDSWVGCMRSRDDNINIIGLDIEWRCKSLTGDHTRPSTLQFCTVQRSPGTKYFSLDEGGGNGYKCLVFQFKDCDKVPQSIVNYLGSKSCVFVSERMTYIKDKLEEHYKLDVAYPIDINQFIKVRKPEKPTNVRNSDWDKSYLDPTQVRNACLDALMSYEEASRFISTNKGPRKVNHRLSLDGMTQYLFGETDPEIAMEEENKEEEEEEEEEDDFDVIVSDEVVDGDYDMVEEDEDFDMISHQDVYDLEYPPLK
ncbi:hypothetical protein ACFX1X_020921 [Malus domestica]